MSRTRLIGVAAVAAICCTFAAVYVIRARRQAHAADGRPSGVSADSTALTGLLERPHAVFRSTRLGVGYGFLVVSSLEPASARYQTDLECDRVDAVSGIGVCLTADRGVLTTYQAVIFGPRFEPLHRISLSGIPSRVRLSPDGRWAGITVFVSGHAYSDLAFSTQTLLVDTRSGDTVADLEQFDVSRDGRPFKYANFNFWGVTFASDSNTFYATLGSDPHLYLVRADAIARRAVIIGEGVECPSLSPDNLRIAFKKRMNVGGRRVWRLAVLDLASGAERLIDGETRNVDDQVEWLDNDRIAYAIADEGQDRGGTSIWSVDVTGGQASLWADGAYSPAIVRSVGERRDP